MFRCVKCGQQKPLTEGNAAAGGLACRACTNPVQTDNEDVGHQLAAAATSKKFLVPIAAGLLVLGTTLFGWRFVFRVLRGLFFYNDD